MLAPNIEIQPQVVQSQNVAPGNAAFFEKFVFVSVLVVAYAIAAAALAYPVLMYVFW